jgi:hypothetical protein
VDTYPCPHCGGLVPAGNRRCPHCGRPYDADAAAYAMLQRTVANLEQKKRDLHSETTQLRGQLAHVTAQRDSMRRKMRERAAEEAVKPKRPLLRRRSRAESDETPVEEPVTVPAQAAPADRGRPPIKRTPPPPPPQQRPAVTAERLQQAVVQPKRIRQRTRPTITRPARPEFPRRESGVDAPETTTTTMQIAVLVLGGVLLAGAAVVLAFYGFGGLAPGVRLLLLTLITAGALATPLVLARRGLRATAETVASVALLLVLLLGYVVRAEHLFGTAAIAPTVYFGLVCVITAAIAAAYSVQSHLVAPRYATLLALQPVLPLLAYDAITGPSGWALVLTGVALIDLGFGIGLGRSTDRRTATGVAGARGARSTLDGDTLAGAPPESTVDIPSRSPVQIADELMRDLAWVLYAVAFAAAAAYAIAALSTAKGLPATVQAATVVLLTATIGVAGALFWRRGPIPDIASGIATLAVVAAFSRVGAVAAPGRALLFAALGVAVATAAITLLPRDARRGPRYAGSAAAAAATLLLLVSALPAIAAPLRAVTPIWHADLARYHQIVADAAGPYGWQLVVATLLLAGAGVLVVPERFREDVAVTGVAFAALVAPAALKLQWLAAPALTVVAAIAAGALALTARRTRTAWILLGAAAVLGCYAAATSLAEPSATALTLFAITIAGAAIAMAPRHARTDPQTEMVIQRVTDGAAGGAIFALPGAAAAAIAIPFTGIPGGATVVLVVSYIALTVSLAVAALSQVIRREQSPPLLIGATAATVAVVIAAVLADGTTPIDYGIAGLMAISAGLIWYAPKLDDRRTFSTFDGEFRGADAATAAVTVAGVASFARAVSLAAPGTEVVTVAVLVLAVAVAARSLPGKWRRGLVAGGAIAGAVAGLYAAVLALIGAVGIIKAANPPWGADLVHWHREATQLINFGGQIPLALFLLAAAAAIALPKPHGDNTASAAIALGAMSAPIGFGLGWQSPMVLGWLVATVLGVWAALASTARAAYTRLTAAGVVGAFAAGASLVTAGATVGTLVALGVSAVIVAATAAFAIVRSGSASAEFIAAKQSQTFATVVGGTAVAGALLAFAAAGTAAAAGLHPAASAALILTASLAATGGGMVVAAAVCLRVPGFLAYNTIGVALSGTIVSIMAVITDRPSAVVFAAAAALLGVLAELVHVGYAPEGDDWRPAPGFRPDRTDQPVLAWRRAAVPGGFTGRVLMAAGVPAAIVVIFAAPAIAAALIGPYRWVSRPWTASADTASNLGAFQRFTGNPTHVLALALLTIAAALVAVGLGGDRQALVNRLVAILVPGIALTVLITPAAFKLGWPAQPTAALLVATMCGLGVALTVPPEESTGEDGIRVARKVVFAIAALSGLAGAAGSLATKQQTLAWLGGSIIVGWVGAWYGKTTIARVIGWQVAASTAEGFAFALAYANGLQLRQCAFPVLFVATLLLVLAAALPRIHPTESVAREGLVLEGEGYLGAAAAIVITFGSAAYTAAALTALGAILGVSAARPGRTGKQRVWLIIAASVSELIAIWLLLRTVHVAVPEAYTLPFAVLALITGLLEIRNRPELGSWVAYGPALVAGFGPSLAIVLSGDSLPLRRVLLIVAAVMAVAIGAQQRQKAPVAVGSVVTVLAAGYELWVAGLPWEVLVVLFGGLALLLLTLGANYERRARFTGVYRGMR